jgi:hypothetical protein
MGARQTRLFGASILELENLLLLPIEQTVNRQLPIGRVSILNEAIGRKTVLHPMFGDSHGRAVLG